MVRPRLCRRVRFNPDITYFKPRGIPLRELEEVILLVDEYEAVRLKDLEGLEQEECAKKTTIIITRHAGYNCFMFSSIIPYVTCAKIILLLGICRYDSISV